ncbi:MULTISPECIES: GNAT family N-acetyltransferase [unclassified Micromonospora]|uniref:GNAT family N-acetyltransferase n=1 Tax=unclassified Micromonospora TaxID=2617518 RepID=UPI002FF24AA9
MPVWTMRSATVADIAAVLEFWQTAAEDAHRPPDSAQALEVLLERDPEALLLALDDSTLIGTVIAGWDGWRCHIYRLAVAPERRRQGIGRLLVEAAEERFHRLGGIRADAMVLDDNAAAHPAWRACGYERQAEWSRWVKPLP